MWYNDWKWWISIISIAIVLNVFKNYQPGSFGYWCCIVVVAAAESLLYHSNSGKP